MPKPKRDPRIVVGSKWMLWIGDSSYGPYAVVGIEEDSATPIVMSVWTSGRIRITREFYGALSSRYQYLSGLEDIIYKRLMED